MVIVCQIFLMWCLYKIFLTYGKYIIRTYLPFVPNTKGRGWNDIRGLGSEWCWHHLFQVARWEGVELDCLGSVTVIAFFFFFTLSFAQKSYTSHHLGWYVRWVLDDATLMRSGSAEKEDDDKDFPKLNAQCEVGR